MGRQRKNPELSPAENRKVMMATYNKKRRFINVSINMNLDSDLVAAANSDKIVFSTFAKTILCKLTPAQIEAINSENFEFAIWEKDLSKELTDELQPMQIIGAMLQEGDITQPLEMPPETIDIEAIKAAARAEGLAEGKLQGFDAGYTEGYADGKKEKPSLEMPVMSPDFDGIDQSHWTN